MFAIYDHLLFAAVAHWHAKTGPTNCEMHIKMDPCSCLFNLNILTCWAYRHTFCEVHPLANYIVPDLEPVTLNVVFRNPSVSGSFNRTISTGAFGINTLKYNKKCDLGQSRTPDPNGVVRRWCGF